MRRTCGLCGSERVRSSGYFLCPKCDAHTDCTVCERQDDTRKRRARRRRKEQ